MSYIDKFVVRVDVTDEEVHRLEGLAHGGVKALAGQMPWLGQLNPTRLEVVFREACELSRLDIVGVVAGLAIAATAEAAASKGFLPFAEAQFADLANRALDYLERTVNTDGTDRPG